MDNQSATGKIKHKVQKLLNQAADREGTAEAETYYAKAFALMAEYGFSERDFSDDGDEVIHREYELGGAYTDMQSRLLLAIATALHCTGFSLRVRRSTRIQAVTLFGLKSHMERVELLFSMLNPAMLAAARCATGHSPCGSTVVQRRSFMSGFAHQIGVRLCAAENDVAEDTEEYALVLVDDRAKADRAQQDYASKHGLHFSCFTSNGSFDGIAFGHGVRAGDASDLGQARFGVKAALPR